MGCCGTTQKDDERSSLVRDRVEEANAAQRAALLGLRHGERLTVPRPQAQAPTLDLSLVGGGRWRLADQHPEAFTMVVFYRGDHCLVCRGYLRQLDRMLDEFTRAGVSVVAVSGDPDERARHSVAEWGLEHLPVGYGQSVESMRDWGLFVSKGIKESEPEFFGEPGIFLIRPDGTVYAEILNSMPFARPHFDEVLKAVQWVNESHYPARGEACLCTEDVAFAPARENEHA